MALKDVFYVKFYLKSLEIVDTKINIFFINALYLNFTITYNKSVLLKYFTLPGKFYR